VSGGRTLVCKEATWSPMAILAVAMVVGPPAARSAAAGDRTDIAAQPAAVVAASCRLPEVELASATADEPAVMLGGISDLWVERIAAGRWRAWAVTDRGPNGMVEVDGRQRRTLVAPSFAPRIVELEIDWNAAVPERLQAAVTGTVVLRDAAGVPLSGRPNGLPGDPEMLDPRGAAVIAADPRGVDTEGLVRMRSGRWWLAEEYGPSLLLMAAAGNVEWRLMPAGKSIAGMDTRGCLPAAYAGRRDNRGFEALALAPDESRAFALLQSPLAPAAREAADRPGLVRLLAFDAATGLPVAEHVYRLGDPAAQGSAPARDEIPTDGKLCAMAALGPESLLVLEQGDGGVVRLYIADLGPATDTLPRTLAGTEPALESLDLAAAGVVPIAKRLVADLAPSLDDLRTSAGLRGPAAGALKLEGLAVADERHVFLVNDDDFGVRGESAAPVPRSCLWVVRLPRPLPLAGP